MIRGFALAEQILDEVCASHGIDHDDLRSRRKNPAFVAARREAAGRMRTETELSFAEIGIVIGRSSTGVIWMLSPHKRSRVRRSR